MKKHKIKQERPEVSSGQKGQRQADLAYFIHDRVELLHQVFSLLKPREIKAMVPDCVRDISLDDLQELCLEELLGISSKRLLAALEGAPPPSDTESSSDDSQRRRGADDLDAISLDSISSDEGALSNEQGSEKSKKHKRCKRREKRKRVDKSKAGAGADAVGERERAAERAGLTVLELLELQARARAIRAQLNAEVERKNAAASAAAAAAAGAASASDDDVEIKEEPAEIVELVSSDDEVKPDLALLQGVQPPPPSQAATNPPATESRTEDETRVVTKRADLTIIVPKTQPTRKIKLNRQKAAPVTTATNAENGPSLNAAVPSTTQSNKDEPEKNVTVITVKDQRKKKDRVKKSKKAKRAKDADGSDHDEITLQLSDSEKMDLLEDFDRKTYDRVSSSSSEDVSEDSDGAGRTESSKQVLSNPKNPATSENVENITVVNESNDNNSSEKKDSENVDNNLVTQDKLEVNAVKGDQQASDSKVDCEESVEEVPAEELAAPKSNEINENGEVRHAEEKSVDEKVGKGKDSTEKLEFEVEVTTVVKNVQEKSETVDENTTDAEKSVEGSAEEQRSPDDVTESTISIVVDDDTEGTLTENGSTVLEEEHKSTATEVGASNRQEAELDSEPVQVLTSEINGAADEIDATDVETTKKPKSKKKRKKNEKKSKKDKKHKD